jgi:hypothetical protein
MTLAELYKNIQDLILAEGENTPCAYMLWLPDDVKSKAEEMDIVVSKEDICTVLNKVHDGADAEYGITWQHIEYEIDEICKRNTKRSI